MFRFANLVVLALAVAVKAAEKQYEFAGMYHMKENTVYTIVFKKVEVGGDGDDGHAHGHRMRREEDEHEHAADPTNIKYVDDNIEIAILKAVEADKSAFEALNATADKALELATKNLSSGCTVSTSFLETSNGCYNIVFNQLSAETRVHFNTTDSEFLGIFFTHGLGEFDGSVVNAFGIEQIPEYSYPEAATTDKDKPWGPAIGSGIVVWCCTLVGLLLILPCFTKIRNNYQNQFDATLAAFASGAILACAFFFLSLEPSHFIGAVYKKEVDVTWRWGTLVLAGFASVFFLDLLATPIANYFGKGGDGASDENFGFQKSKDVKDNDGENDTSAWKRILSGVIIGEIMHNFADGVLIGTAFIGCGNSFGWTVAAATVYHELAQEVSDFFLLIGPGGFVWWKAVLINVLSGASVLLGIVLILAIDIPMDAQGYILAFGGGVYIEIGAVECMGRIQRYNLDMKWKLVTLVTFIIGAICIGLVLFDHEHCSVDASGNDAHAGHNH